MDAQRGGKNATFHGRGLLCFAIGFRCIVADIDLKDGLAVERDACRVAVHSCVGLVGEMEF